jgi:hypothetical protein
MAGWWGGKVRQTWRHLTGRVSPRELAALGTWLTPAQLRLFEAMHPADRRHGLDVVSALRAAGHDEPELLLAGLFHDAAKGPTVRLVHRIAWSLGERYGSGVSRAAAWLPGFAPALERIRVHAERSAEMALAAGCSVLTADLIRHQDRPADPVLGRALLLADQAS